MLYLKLFLLALLSFFLLDLLWLGWIARGFYREGLSAWMSGQTDWLAAGVFYVLFLTGLVFFVLVPSLDGSGLQVLLRGGFFGLITYGTYELTNKAVIAGWPWKVVVVDMAWGVVLCGLVSWLSWMVARYFGWA